MDPDELRRVRAVLPDCPLLIGSGLTAETASDLAPLAATLVGETIVDNGDPGFSLLGDSYMNYWGKMMFKWVYWNMMLKGVELPLEDQLTMAGKMRHTLVTE